MYNLIGIPVFRYQHVAHEQWSDACLAKLAADTDHDGKKISVVAENDTGKGQIHIVNATNDEEKSAAWNGCLMTFAYWNPQIRQQKRLLNPETGEVEPVIISQEPNINIPVHGKPTEARVWRIKGTHDPVDVLYDSQDNWIGLNAKVKGGRQLSYRLP